MQIVLVIFAIIGIIGALLAIVIFFIKIESFISDKVGRKKLLQNLKSGDKVYCCNFETDDNGNLLINRDSISEEVINVVYYSKFLWKISIAKITTDKGAYVANDFFIIKNNSLWRKDDIDFFITELNNEKTLSDIMYDDKQLIIRGLKTLLQQSLKYNMNNVSERVAMLIEKLETN